MRTIPAETGNGTPAHTLLIKNSTITIPLKIESTTNIF
jgi:hypothetical protein